VKSILKKEPKPQHSAVCDLSSTDMQTSISNLESGASIRSSRDFT